MKEGTHMEDHRSRRAGGGTLISQRRSPFPYPSKGCPRRDITPWPGTETHHHGLMGTALWSTLWSRSRVSACGTGHTMPFIAAAPCSLLCAVFSLVLESGRWLAHICSHPCFFLLHTIRNSNPIFIVLPLHCTIHRFNSLSWSSRCWE